MCATLSFKTSKSFENYWKSGFFRGFNVSQEVSYEINWILHRKYCVYPATNSYCIFLTKSWNTAKKSYFSEVTRIFKIYIHSCPWSWKQMHVSEWHRTATKLIVCHLRSVYTNKVNSLWWEQGDTDPLSLPITMKKSHLKNNLLTTATTCYN